MLERAICRNTKAVSAKIQQRFFLSVCIILARPLARLVSSDCQSPGGGLASASSPHQKGGGQYGLGSYIQAAAQRVHTSGSNPTRTTHLREFGAESLDKPRLLAATAADHLQLLFRSERSSFRWEANFSPSPLNKTTITG